MHNDGDNNDLFRGLDPEDFFENALSGFAIADPKGQLLRVNKILAGWIGGPPEAIQSKRFSDILSVGGKIYYETHLWPLLRIQGYFDEVAVEFSSGNKPKMPVLINAIERKNASGQPQFIWFTIVKATDRYTYEQNLKEAKISLEISLANAQQVTILREQLIAILGHDLRNPLGAVLAGVSMLSDAGLSESNKKIIPLIHRSSLRMAELVNNIMDFARTRLGEGIVVNRQWTMMEPVLTEIIEEQRTIYPNRQIEITFDLQGPVLCDAPRIVQLLANLVANAVTHGSHNTPVRIAANQRDAIFELIVCNEGNPMSPELLTKLFEPFTRETHRPSQNGLGLGLYIAAQIAKAHSAELSASSSAKETCFEFRLPNTCQPQ